MRSYGLLAGILFAAWLAAAAWMISLFASGKSDLGRGGDVMVIAAILLCTAYIAWVLWRRRPAR